MLLLIATESWGNDPLSAAQNWLKMFDCSITCGFSRDDKIFARTWLSTFKKWSQLSPPDSPWSCCSSVLVSLWVLVVWKHLAGLQLWAGRGWNCSALPCKPGIKKGICPAAPNIKKCICEFVFKVNKKFSGCWTAAEHPRADWQTEKWSFCFPPPLEVSFNT